MVETSDGYVLPVSSVGVQGDSRSYRAVLAIAHEPAAEDVQLKAPALTNRIAEINRVVALCGATRRSRR